MIKLGIFRTKENNSYAGHYFPESKKAEAVGPLTGTTGARAPVFETIANSEEEARKKIEEAIESGELK